MNEAELKTVVVKELEKEVEGKASVTERARFLLELLRILKQN